MARPSDRSAGAGSARTGSAKTGSDALARVIRDRREQLGMTRQQLADATGVPYPTIAQVETAYRGVSPSRLGVLARALGLDPKELYDVLARAEPGSSAGSPPTRGDAARDRSGGWHANPSFAAGAAAPGVTATGVTAGGSTAAGGTAAGGTAAGGTAAGSVAGEEDVRPLAMSARGGVDDDRDVVDRVLELLGSLPADRRLDALARVQSRLLAGLVQEEVRRATRRR